jgi:hypothetical protein
MAAVVVVVHTAVDQEEQELVVKAMQVQTLVLLAAAAVEHRVVEVLPLVGMVLHMVGFRLVVVVVEVVQVV